MSNTRFVAMGYDLGKENNDWLRARFPQLTFDVFEKSRPADPQRLARAEVLFGYGNVAHIAPAARVRYIHTMSAGIDGYLEAIDAHPAPHIQLSNSAGLYGPAVGEHALALLLAATHGIKPSVLGMQRGEWKNHPMLGDVAGATAAVLGTGDIGTHVATALRAMGAHVLGYKLHEAEPFPPYHELFFGNEGLSQMLPRADFVIICLPGTQFTQGLIGTQQFSQMKNGVILVNIGRGTIVDTDAMMDALRSGQLAALATDVTDPEPLPPAHPLWQMPNVIITPHYSGLGVRPQAHARWFAENLEAYLAGKPLPGAVDHRYKY